MGTDITKVQQQNAMQPTWKLLYEADWEQGFNTFMLILAQQYKIELMIQIGNQKQPSPVIEFWREGLKGLSPQQMTEGLRGWQRTEQGNFQPTPENIRECGELLDAADKPRRVTNRHCEACNGTGWRSDDGRMYRELNGQTKNRLMRCDCSVICYRGEVYREAKFQLAAAPEDRKQSEVERAIPEIPPAKSIPSAYVPSDAELERKKREAIEAAKKYS